MIKIEESRHRYYCLYRPPAPGAIPRGAIEIKDYDNKQFEPSVNRRVWGWAEYSVPLTREAIDDYDLIAANVDSED